MFNFNNRFNTPEENQENERTRKEQQQSIIEGQQSNYLQGQIAGDYVSNAISLREQSFDSQMYYAMDVFNFYNDINNGFEYGQVYDLEQTTSTYKKMYDANSMIYNYSPTKELEYYTNITDIIMSSEQYSWDEATNMYIEARNKSMQISKNQNRINKLSTGTLLENSSDKNAMIGGSLMKDPVGSYFGDIGPTIPDSYGSAVTSVISPSSMEYLGDVILEGDRRNKEKEFALRDEIYQATGWSISGQEFDALMRSGSTLYSIDAETGEIDPIKLKQYQQWQQKNNRENDGFWGYADNFFEDMLNGLNFFLQGAVNTVGYAVSGSTLGATNSLLYLADPFVEKDLSTIAGTRRTDWIEDVYDEASIYVKSWGMSDTASIESLFNGPQEKELYEKLNDNGIANFIFNQLLDPLTYLTAGASAGADVAKLSKKKSGALTAAKKAEKYGQDYSKIIKDLGSYDGDGKFISKGKKTITETVETKNGEFLDNVVKKDYTKEEYENLIKISDELNREIKINNETIEEYLKKSKALKKESKVKGIDDSLKTQKIRQANVYDKIIYKTALRNSDILKTFELLNSKPESFKIGFSSAALYEDVAEAVNFVTKTDALPTRVKALRLGDGTRMKVRTANNYEQFLNAAESLKYTDIPLDSFSGGVKRYNKIDEFGNFWVGDTILDNDFLNEINNKLPEEFRDSLEKGEFSDFQQLIITNYAVTKGLEKRAVFSPEGKQVLLDGSSITNKDTLRGTLADEQINDQVEELYKKMNYGYDDFEAVQPVLKKILSVANTSEFELGRAQYLKALGERFDQSPGSKVFLTRMYDKQGPDKFMSQMFDTSNYKKTNNFNRIIREKVTDANSKLKETNLSIDASVSKVYGDDEISNLVTQTTHDKVVKGLGEKTVNKATTEFLSWTNQSGNALTRRDFYRALGINDDTSARRSTLLSLNDGIDETLLEEFDRKFKGKIGDIKALELALLDFKTEIINALKSLDDGSIIARVAKGIEENPELMDEAIWKYFIDEYLFSNLKPYTKVHDMGDGLQFYEHRFDSLERLNIDNILKIGENEIDLSENIEFNKAIKQLSENYANGIMNELSVSDKFDFSTGDINAFLRNAKNDFDKALNNNEVFSFASKDLQPEVFEKKLLEKGIPKELLPEVKTVISKKDGKIIDFEKIKPLSDKELDRLNELYDKYKNSRKEKISKEDYNKYKKIIKQHDLSLKQLEAKTQQLDNAKKAYDKMFNVRYKAEFLSNFKDKAFLIKDPNVYDAYERLRVKQKSVKPEDGVLSPGLKDIIPEKAGLDSLNDEKITQAFRYNFATFVFNTDRLIKELRANPFTKGIVSKIPDKDKKRIQRIRKTITSDKLPANRTIDNYLDTIYTYLDQEIYREALENNKLELNKLAADNIKTSELIKKKNMKQKIEQFDVEGLTSEEVKELSSLYKQHKLYKKESELYDKTLFDIREGNGKMHFTNKYDLTKLIKNGEYDDKIVSAISSIIKEIETPDYLNNITKAEMSGFDNSFIPFGRGKLYDKGIEQCIQARKEVLEFLGEESGKLYLDGVSTALLKESKAKATLLLDSLGPELFDKSEIKKIERYDHYKRQALGKRDINGKLINEEKVITDDIRIPHITNADFQKFVDDSLEVSETTNDKGRTGSILSYTNNRDLKAPLDIANHYIKLNVPGAPDYAKPFETDFNTIVNNSAFNSVRDVSTEVAKMTITEYINDYRDLTKKKGKSKGRTFIRMDDFINTDLKGFTKDQKQFIQEGILAKANEAGISHKTTSKIELGFKTKDYAYLQNQLGVFKAITQPTKWQEYADVILSGVRVSTLFGAFNIKFNLSTVLLLSGLEGAGNIRRTGEQILELMANEKAFAKLVNDEEIANIILSSNVGKTFEESIDFISNHPKLTTQQKRIITSVMNYSKVRQSSKHLKGKRLVADSDDSIKQLQFIKDGNSPVNPVDAAVQKMKEVPLFKHLLPNFDPMENAVVLRAMQYLDDDALYRKHATNKGMHAPSNPTIDDIFANAAAMASDDLGVGEAVTLEKGWGTWRGVANKAFLFPSFFFRGLPKMAVNYLSTGDNIMKMLRTYDQMRMTQQAAGLSQFEQSQMSVRDRMMFSLAIPGTENGWGVNLFSPLDVFKTLQEGVESRSALSFISQQMNPLITTPLEMLVTGELDAYGRSLGDQSPVTKFRNAVEAGDGPGAAKYGIESLLNGIGGQPGSMIVQITKMINGKDKYGNRIVSPNNSDAAIQLSNMFRAEFGLIPNKALTINDVPILGSLFKSRRSYKTDPYDIKEDVIKDTIYDLQNIDNEQNARLAGFMGSPTGGKVLKRLKLVDELSAYKRVVAYIMQTGGNVDDQLWVGDSGINSEEGTTENLRRYNIQRFMNWLSEG